MIKIASYLTVFFLPAYLLRVAVLGIPANVFEIMVMILLVLQLSNKKYRKRFYNVLVEHREYFIPAGMIFSGLLISTFVHGAYVRGFGIIKGWFLIPIVLFLLLRSFHSPQERKNIFKALYWSSFTVSLAGLFYFFQGNLTYDGRLQAFFNSPNYLAMYLAPAVIIGVSLCEENRKVYFLSLGVILAALYLTFSYAAWIALLGAFMICVVLAGKHAVFKKAYVAVLIIFIAFISQMGAKKMHDLLKLQERSSFASRIMIWKASAKIASDQWLWGVGPGNFQDTYLRYQKYFPPYLEWAVPHPHNVYMAFWLQAGLLGFVGFLWLIWAWIRRYLRLKENADPVLRNIMVGIMAYILLHGLVDTTYFKNDLAVVFWLSLW